MLFKFPFEFRKNWLHTKYKCHLYLENYIQKKYCLRPVKNKTFCIQNWTQVINIMF